MMRTQVVKLARATPSVRRSFASSALRAAEGDTGGMRSGGSRSGDAFSKREAAEEGRWIKQKEKEALEKLKEKLKMQRTHLDELENHIKELEKQSGGE
ncbi:uncharacterized protein HMPREF1541_07516 [Cyphellophora europaea CBS 101466]|uniref:ATPase inhibitor, mitochondrial n=1 Tax=Cyphellophora europaea (strain CBS 101466) TaxID=1220924 RepID=W2RQC6_CYPE1|nr:uncharacterized protein HMPREF1541_07516 [Cyphellophora europaea CBS 101466]ETN37893.1 hypothetical protein HMPREF1541_07516 [Cyphellophora europaea CBS 101466]